MKKNRFILGLALFIVLLGIIWLFSMPSIVEASLIVRLLCFIGCFAFCYMLYFVFKFRKKCIKKGFFILSLLLIILFFFFAFKQDYAQTIELYSIGIKPNMTYHWLAVLSIMISGIFWWVFLAINKRKKKGGQSGRL